MKFKNYLPCDCPDDNIDNIEEDEKFFRVTKMSPPINSDFTPLWFFRNFPKEQECIAKGLSVSEKFEDAKTLIKTFKKMGKYIYSGTICYRKHGIVKLTPSQTNPSHRTWYPLVGITESSIFDTKEER